MAVINKLSYQNNKLNSFLNEYIGTWMRENGGKKRHSPIGGLDELAKEIKKELGVIS
jgi:hypothetical protein